MSTARLSIDVEARMVTCGRCGAVEPVVPSTISKGIIPGKWEEWSINSWHNPPGWAGALGKDLCPACAELVRVVIGAKP